MILSTTPAVDGYIIKEYKGIVTGETIIGANIVKDFFAGIRDVVGGRVSKYEQVLAQAKDTSMQEMVQRAEKMGANAVVGIDIDYETLGNGNSMLMVATSGTAVVIQQSTAVR
ncbi:MAG: heavy metal-binding domain-containing protein [Bacteroidales bacterium]|nr:heavy metal-binding domain-containing protein [Bacteroidales bacterium]